jgi:hypothetical protein
MSTMTSPSNASSANDICRAVLESKSSDRVEISIPGTSYRLQFTPVSPITGEVGKRILGRVRGRALRLHAAQAGGKFIEPVYGHPRIVQGTILGYGPRGASGDALLVDMAIPVWLSLDAGQTAGDFPVGTMVNMYVESGMTFEEVR